MDGDRCNTFVWLHILTQHRLRLFSVVHDEMCGVVLRCWDCFAQKL